MDGEDIYNIGDKLVSKVLGPEGTSVTITVDREGNTVPTTVTLLRGSNPSPAQLSARSVLLRSSIAYTPKDYGAVDYFLSPEDKKDATSEAAARVAYIRSEVFGSLFFSVHTVLLLLLIGPALRRCCCC